MNSNTALIISNLWLAASVVINDPGKWFMSMVIGVLWFVFSLVIIFGENKEAEVKL